MKVPNFGIQGGDITENNGVGGESIYGGYFDDESFEVCVCIAWRTFLQQCNYCNILYILCVPNTIQVQHNKVYLLSSANKGPNTNNSQFFINTVKTSWLDNKNVVFGMVLAGFEYVDEIEAVGQNDGKPLAEVTIKKSGEVKGSWKQED